MISWTLARAEASLVALFVYVQPVVAAALGVAFQGESLSLRTVTGAVLIFGGVYLVTWGHSAFSLDASSGNALE